MYVDRPKKIYYKAVMLQCIIIVRVSNWYRMAQYYGACTHKCP